MKLIIPNIMKQILLSFIALSMSLSVAAQSAATDSVAVEELGEVVVQAPKVVRKADMDVYHPSRRAIEISKNGMQLLRNLMIPSLSVNDVLGSVTASGQAVQVRINGRQASIDDVKSLLPETVKRIEWIDNPGLRYGDATHVLNFIVRNPDMGGSLMANTNQALAKAWGEYMADAKLNNGRSQWELYGNFKLTDNFNTGREYKETFTYPDGSSLTRRESSLGGTLSNNFGNAKLSYSYIKPDTTVFYASFYTKRDFSESTRFDGLLSLSNGADDILLNDHQGKHGTRPGLSLYLEQHFAGKQTLVVDMSGNFYMGRSFSHYIESLPGQSDPLTDVVTNIRDRNKAFSVEANYIKRWASSRLTAGASYTGNRNRSTYENLDGRVYHQRQDRSYFFAEYFQRIGKVTLTGGIGAQYTDFLSRESDRGNHSWNLRPRFTLSYRPTGSSQFKLNFNSWQTAPSLSETNVAPQQTDGFQWRIGNSELETSNSYRLSLNYNFSLPRINGSFIVMGFTSPNAITPYLFWDEDRLVTSYENSRGLQNLTFRFSPQIEVIPDWLVVSGTVQYRAERMRGTGYKLYNHNWSGEGAIQLAHSGFEFMFMYRRAQRDLWGEKISWGEDLTFVSLAYNWKKWQFGVGMVMPFGKYDQGSMSLNKYNTNEMHLRPDIKRMPFVAISYNLQWGRQKRGASKLIDSNAEADKSTAGGR